MHYADCSDSRRAAEPGLTGSCPSCDAVVIPKCGTVRIWHWAHVAGGDCDPWSEPMTQWHLDWQSVVSEERREVVIGAHRADMVTADGWIVEIQHSRISSETIREREDFYGARMVWIFDGRDAFEQDRLRIHYGPQRFRWWNAPGSIGVCQRDVLIDVGNGHVLRALTPSCIASGPVTCVVLTRESVEGWLRDGVPMVASLVIVPLS